MGCWEFNSLSRSHSWTCPSCCISVFLGFFNPPNACVIYSEPLPHVYLLCALPPTPLPMQLFPLPQLQTSSHPLLRPLFPLLIRLGFSNGKQIIFLPELMNFFTFCRSHLYSGIQPQLFFIFADSWILCVQIALTLGLAFCSPDDLNASGGVFIVVRRGLSFSKLSTFLSSLDPYLTMWRSNIFLKNFSQTSKLVFALQEIVEYTSFLCLYSLGKSFYSRGLQLS